MIKQIVSKQIELLEEKISDYACGFYGEYDPDDLRREAIATLVGTKEGPGVCLTGFDRGREQYKLYYLEGFNEMTNARTKLIYGDFDAAIQHVCAANFALGKCWGVYDLNRARGEDSGDARHAENRSDKEKVIEHYKNNRNDFRTKDDAALVIFKTVGGGSVSTVRKYLKGV